MARKINVGLKKKLMNGSLKQLLNYLQQEQHRLKLEVRRYGKFIIYYKKCKVLEVGLNKCSVDEKYFEKGKYPQNIAQTITLTPRLYFDNVCAAVDAWLEKNTRNEFETQQSIAYHNQQKDDKYVVLDMEYQFSQEKIKKSERVKSAAFDLLGVNTTTNDIVFFEVKRGINALTSQAGIKSHINDFEQHFYGKYRNVFLDNLLIDIRNIVKDKNDLELLDYTLSTDFLINDVKLIFIFEPDSKTDIEKYHIIFERENTSSHKSDYGTIFVSKENYKLK